jgi:plasmid stabilization system protein ParE
MAFRYVLLPKAQEDYEGIVQYLSDKLQSMQAAKGFVDEFDRQVALVCENPSLHALSRFEELAELGYRTFLINNYIALYRTCRDLVVVAHIFHQTQGYASLV